MAKLKRIWDNFKVLGEVQKSDSIKLVFAAAARDGVRYLNIREFYIRKRDGEWRPGLDGITIPYLVPVEGGTKLISPVTNLIDLLPGFADVLKNFPISDEANAVWIEVKEKVK